MNSSTTKLAMIITATTLLHTPPIKSMSYPPQAVYASRSQFEPTLKSLPETSQLPETPPSSPRTTPADLKHSSSYGTFNDWHLYYQNGVPPPPSVQKQNTLHVFLKKLQIRAKRFRALNNPLRTPIHKPTHRRKKFCCFFFQRECKDFDDNTLE